MRELKKYKNLELMGLALECCGFKKVDVNDAYIGLGIISGSIYDGGYLAIYKTKTKKFFKLYFVGFHKLELDNARSENFKLNEIERVVGSDTLKSSASVYRTDMQDWTFEEDFDSTIPDEIGGLTTRGVGCFDSDGWKRFRHTDGLYVDGEMFRMIKREDLIDTDTYSYEALKLCKQCKIDPSRIVRLNRMWFRKVKGSMDIKYYVDIPFVRKGDIDDMYPPVYMMEQKELTLKEALADKTGDGKK